MVVLRQWSVDVIALLVFLIAAYLGYKDTFRFSFLQLILQLISMIATYFISIFLTNKAIQTIPENENIGLMIPDELFYLVQPHEEMIIPLIMFVIIYMFIFIIIKSILYVFGRNYEWERYLFRKIKLNSTFGRILSSGCTILNTYTYLIIVLMIVGFPLFNLVGPHTFSSFLLKTVPFISKDIEEFYAPYETLTQVLQTYKEEAHLIFDGTTVNLKVMEEMIQKDPSRKNSLQDAYEYLIPYIATTSGYNVQKWKETKMSRKNGKKLLIVIAVGAVVIKAVRDVIKTKKQEEALKTALDDFYEEELNWWDREHEEGEEL